MVLSWFMTFAIGNPSSMWMNGLMKSIASRRLENKSELTHIIHGTGIFTYIWWIFMGNVGKYTSPMDAMGNIIVYLLCI